MTDYVALRATLTTQEGAAALSNFSSNMDTQAAAIATAAATIATAIASVTSTIASAKAAQQTAKVTRLELYQATEYRGVDPADYNPESIARDKVRAALVGASVPADLYAWLRSDP